MDVPPADGTRTKVSQSNQMPSHASTRSHRQGKGKEGRGDRCTIARILGMTRASTLGKYMCLCKDLSRSGRSAKTTIPTNITTSKSREMLAALGSGGGDSATYSLPRKSTSQVSIYPHRKIGGSSAQGRVRGNRLRRAHFSDSGAELDSRQCSLQMCLQLHKWAASK
jgi:hypothetical protein